MNPTPVRMSATIKLYMYLVAMGRAYACMFIFAGDKFKKL